MSEPIPPDDTDSAGDVPVDEAALEVSIGHHPAGRRQRRPRRPVVHLSTSDGAATVTTGPGGLEVTR